MCQPPIIYPLFMGGRNLNINVFVSLCQQIWKIVFGLDIFFLPNLFCNPTCLTYPNLAELDKIIDIFLFFRVARQLQIFGKEDSLNMEIILVRIILNVFQYIIKILHSPKICDFRKNVAETTLI